MQNPNHGSTFNLRHRNQSNRNYARAHVQSHLPQWRSAFSTRRMCSRQIRRSIRIDQGLDQDTSAGSASTLTPTATSSSPQHFAFIRSSVFLDNGSYEVNAYPIVSFSRSGGAIAGYNRLPPDDQARLIPLPPLWDERPTPAAFGNQFDLRDFSFNKNY
jgi:hypothetical protein